MKGKREERKDPSLFTPPLSPSLSLIHREGQREENEKRGKRRERDND